MNSHENIKAHLQTLFDAYLDLYRREYGTLPVTQLDAEWHSPCIDHSEGDNQSRFWKPVPKNDAGIFDGLENGLSTPIHDSIKAYYGCYWSDGIVVDSPWGQLGLIQVWNEADLDILRQNLLSHTFMKTKKKQPLNFFIATTKGNDIVVVDNAGGDVYLERPGRRPHQQIALSLAEFLSHLSPTTISYADF